MHMKLKFFISALMICASQAGAQSISGRLNTSLYGWQGRDLNDGKLNFLRGYENIQLEATSGQFSLGTNLQVSNDFATKIGTDPELRLSSLVFRAHRVADVVDIAVGRQFVFAGVGNGIIDGADLRFSVLQGRLGAQLYGGYNVVETRTLNWKKALADNPFPAWRGGTRR